MRRERYSGWMIHGFQGRTSWRRLRKGLGTANQAAFDLVREWQSPTAQRVLPTLTQAANYSMLWAAIAAAMHATGNPSLKAGATRGMTAIAATSLVADQLAKRLVGQNRPGRDSVPPERRLSRYPRSSSWPSGHAAAAATFVLAVSASNKAVGVALAPLAVLIGLSRVYTGAHYPGDVLAGFAIGAGVSRLVQRAAGQKSARQPKTKTSEGGARWTP